MKGQFNLAALYADVKGDFEAAYGWFKASADQGYSRAQTNLGSFFFEGKGVAKDMAKAAQYFSLAAAQNDVIAQHRLSIMYIKGEGVPQDNAKGLRCAQLCTENGHAGGMALLNMFQETFESVGERDLISHVNYDSHLPGTNITVVCLQSEASRKYNGRAGKVVQKTANAAIKAGRVPVLLHGEEKAMSFKLINLCVDVPNHPCPLCLRNEDDAVMDGDAPGICCACGQLFCGACTEPGNRIASGNGCCPVCTAALSISRGEEFKRLQALLHDVPPGRHTPSAQCELGKQYVVGKSVAQDYATAMKWIRLAADQDHTEAQTVLGLLYKTEGTRVQRVHLARSVHTHFCILVYSREFMCGLWRYLFYPRTQPLCGQSHFLKATRQKITRRRGTGLRLQRGKTHLEALARPCSIWVRCASKAWAVQPTLQKHCDGFSLQDRASMPKRSAPLTKYAVIIYFYFIKKEK